MKLHDLLRSIGSAPFRSESGHPKWDAQRNLQGRTHYVDDDTLKGFKARILDAGLAHDGLTYWLIESVGSKPTDPRRNKRFVAFDVFGTVLTLRDDWRATKSSDGDLYLYGERTGIYLRGNPRSLRSSRWVVMMTAR